MNYDEQLVDRIRSIMKRKRGLTEKRMFGGLAFLINGKMLCGVQDNLLMVRVGPVKYEEALMQKHVKKMDFTGRPLKGFIYVGPEGLKRGRSLNFWIEAAWDYVKSLPKK